MPISLSPRDQSLLIDALLSTLTGLAALKVDYERLAAIQGLKNKAVTKAACCPLKKKILEQVGVGGEQGEGPGKGEGEGSAGGASNARQAGTTPYRSGRRTSAKVWSGG